MTMRSERHCSPPPPPSPVPESMERRAEGPSLRVVADAAREVAEALRALSRERERLSRLDVYAVILAAAPALTQLRQRVYAAILRLRGEMDRAEARGIDVPACVWPLMTIAAHVLTAIESAEDDAAYAADVERWAERIGGGAIRDDPPRNEGGERDTEPGGGS
jgi:hypothetical protein